ncbi:hypothetical protein Bpfe_011501, partial [Biomphalaria pfeifferi]
LEDLVVVLSDVYLSALMLQIVSTLQRWEVSTPLHLRTLVELRMDQSLLVELRMAQSLLVELRMAQSLLVKLRMAQSLVHVLQVMQRVQGGTNERFECRLRKLRIHFRCIRSVPLF